MFLLAHRVCVKFVDSILLSLMVVDLSSLRYCVLPITRVLQNRCLVFPFILVEVAERAWLILVIASLGIKGYINPHIYLGLVHG